MRRYVSIYGYKDLHDSLSHDPEKSGFDEYRKRYEYQVVAQSNPKFVDGLRAGGIAPAMHFALTYTNAGKNWEGALETDYPNVTDIIVDDMPSKPHAVKLSYPYCKKLADRTVKLLKASNCTEVFLDTWWTNDYPEFKANYELYVPYYFKVLRQLLPGILISGQFGHYYGLEVVDFVKKQNIHMLYKQRIDATEPWFEGSLKTCVDIFKGLPDRYVAVEFRFNFGDIVLLSRINQDIIPYMGARHYLRLRDASLSDDMADIGYYKALDKWILG